MLGLSTMVPNDPGGFFPEYLVTITSSTPQWQSPEPPPQGFQLGREWIVREGEWSGTWRRRGDSEVFGFMDNCRVIARV